MAKRLSVKDGIQEWINKINAILDLQNVDGAFVNSDTSWDNTVFTISGGKVRSGTNIIDVPGASKTLPVASISVVGVDVQNGVIEHYLDGSVPATDFIPLYVVTTNNTRITSVEDARTWAYEDSGAAANAVSEHEGKADPHSQYYKDGDDISLGHVTTGSGADQDLGEALDQRVIYVDTLADLQALDASGLVDGQGLKITTTGRAGDFVVRVGDFSTEVTNDPESGVWVPFDSDPTGSTIVAMREYNRWSSIDTGWFGSVAGQDSNASIQAAVDYRADVIGAGRVRIRGDSQPYRFTQIDLRAAGMWLHGDGRQSTELQLTDTASSANAFLQKQPYQKVTDLRVNGNRDNVVGYDCFDAETTGFNGFSLYENIIVEKFDGIAIKTKNSNLTELREFSCSRVKVGLTTERCVPLILNNFDVGKWTTNAIVVNGTPTRNMLIGNGIYIEASVDTPDIGASAIKVFASRKEDFVKIRGLYINGQFNASGFDTVGIEVLNPITVDNLDIEGTIFDTKTPYKFDGVDIENEVGTNYLDKIRVTGGSGAPAREVGFLQETSQHFSFLSDELDLSASTTQFLWPFEDATKIRLHRCVMLVTSATGGTATGVNLGVDGQGNHFGTVNEPVSASSGDTLDITGLLTRLEVDIPTSNRIVASTGGGSTGKVKLMIEGWRY